MPSKLIARVALIGLIAIGALPALAQSAPPRLALVIGEANYAGGALQTVAADATLVAQTLTAEGFDVSEFHDLDHTGLADNTAAFVNKVRAAPAGAAVTVYLSGIGAIADCDDVLLPIDAHIANAAEVARQGLSMTKLMRDLSATSSAVHLVLLDGARPAPPEVSSIALPRGLLPLHAPHATTFGLSAEIHDFAPSPQPGDTDGAYAASFANVAQQPLTDLETSMRAVRMATHQATGGAQTPWQDTNPDTPSFALALNVDPQQAQGAAETLPNSTSPIGKLNADDAYLAAIWRNSIPDYEAYLNAFQATAPNELLARIRALVETLKTPGPSCQAAVAPAPLPRKIVAGPLCPAGFVPEDGYDGAYCAPIDPPPMLACPPGLTRVAGVDGFGCAPIEPRPTLDCPVGFRIYGDRDHLRRLGLAAYCEPEQPPPFVCPPGLHAAFHNGAQFCVHDGPPPPLCPAEMHPIWDGQGAYECFANPIGEPIVCQGGRPQWNFDHWICVNAPGRHADFCRPGEIEMWQNGRAVCAPPPPPPSVCPPGYFRVGGACVADILPGIAIGVGIGAAIGAGSHGGPPDAACPPGQPRVNGRCVIQPGPGGHRPPGVGDNGQNSQGGAPACAAGQIVVNGHCVNQPGPGGPRPPGSNGQNQPGGAPACPAGQIAQNGHCVAQPGPAATPRPTPTVPAQPTPAITPRPTPPAGNGQDHSGAPPACPAGQIAVNGLCAAQPGAGATPRPTPAAPAQPTPAITPKPTPAQPTPTPKATPTLTPRPTPTMQPKPAPTQMSTPKAVPAPIPTPKPVPPPPPAPKPPPPPPPPPPKPAPPPPPAPKPPPPPPPKPAATQMPVKVAPPGGHGRPGCPNPRDPACPPGG